MRVPSAQWPYELVGASGAVRECVAQVERAGTEDRGVLMTAAPGLDTEAIARTIHGQSARREGPFVGVACDGAPAAELERLLFGVLQRGGRFDLEVVGPGGALSRAQGGTLFLTNLHELPPALQRRLARILRDGEARIARRGGTVTLNVRPIGTTDVNLSGALRDDILRRLPLVIDVPPLRARRDDVPAIAARMLAARGGSRQFTTAALTVLAALPWRRNTTELSRLIDRLAAAEHTPLIRQEDVLAEVQLDRTPSRPAGSLREARRQFEREYIAAVLREHEWQMREAARTLGIERANLYRKARQLGIPLRRAAGADSRIS